MTLDQFRQIVHELRSFDHRIHELVLHPSDMTALLQGVREWGEGEPIGILDGVTLRAEETQERGVGTFVLGASEERRYLLRQGGSVWDLPGGFTSTVFLKLHELNLRPLVLRMDEALAADTRWRLKLPSPRPNGFFGLVNGTALMADEALPRGVVFVEAVSLEGTHVQLVFHAHDPESPFEFLTPDPQYPDTRALESAFEAIREHVGWMGHRDLKFREHYDYDHPHVIHRIECVACDFAIEVGTHEMVSAGRTDLLDPYALRATLGTLAQEPIRGRTTDWSRLRR